MIESESEFLMEVTNKTKGDLKARILPLSPLTFVIVQYLCHRREGLWWIMMGHFGYLSWLKYRLSTLRTLNLVR